MNRQGRVTRPFAWQVRGRGEGANMAVVRAWALGLLVLAIWFVCVWASRPHDAMIPANGNPASFSAAHAEAVLARVLGPERPHPVGSAENEEVRARILNELAMLGVPARTYRAFTCNAWRGFSFVACATVTDIVGVVVSGPGKATVMMAHYDSVPAGPGASDDESGVATILESIRALKTGGAGKHPLIALFTDGEEAGLLGANAFLENPELKALVGAVVNVEARGTSGQSLLFQTSPGDARLVDLYAAHVPTKATSSLYAEIYKFLPNDTDLTLFIRDGFPSLNFAFADNVRYYHSPRDTRTNLDPATLQMHGDNVLGVVRGLQQTDFAALKAGNDVYVSILGVWLPRIPQWLALPLTIVALLLIVLAVWLARPQRTARGGFLLSALMPLAFLFGCVSVGFLLAWIAQTISGVSDPSYANPLPMRIALAFGVWGMALLVSRMTALHGATSAAWLWIATFAIATAALLPGLSPYFLFPAIVAAVLLIVGANLRGGWNAPIGQAVLLIGALVALVIWMALVASGETLMGLRLHPLFTVPAAFGLLAVVPLLSARPMAQATWLASVTLSFVIALAAAITAGLMPAYSEASPQRLNLIYFESGKHPARWIAETAWKATATESIPASLKNAGHFTFDSDAYAGLKLGSGYVAPAGAPRLPLPSANVTSDRVENSGRVVSLVLLGLANTDAMSLRIPKQASMTALRVRGENVPIAKGWSGDTLINCDGRDCSDLAVTLTLGNRGAVVLPFAERRRGLPEWGRALASARPNTAMPSQEGDRVILANSLKLSRHQ
jgi:hypothetical protein